MRKRCVSATATPAACAIRLLAYSIAPWTIFGRAPADDPLSRRSSSKTSSLSRASMIADSSAHLGEAVEEQASPTVGQTVVAYDLQAVKEHVRGGEDSGPQG